jgi:hypothetical protein
MGHLALDFVSTILLAIAGRYGTQFHLCKFDLDPMLDTLLDHLGALDPVLLDPVLLDQMAVLDRLAE